MSDTIPNPSATSAPEGVAGEQSNQQDGPQGHEHGYLHHGNKDAYLKRLRRVEGQIRGLQRMVDSEAYCIDILTQVSAATKALQSVALGLLDEHLNHCVAEAVRDGGPQADAKLAEASEAIARLVRS
ncbi:MAG: metal-sensitive transcriptional regulator [Nocardioides sp.]|uniref:metal-sensitive transcriptional regulator n=1 Tax=Nocardioides sp. TaxID=35761 RepID=UPI0039E5F28B